VYKNTINDAQSSNVRTSMEKKEPLSMVVSRSPRDLINNQNLTSTSFDFNPLGEDKVKKLSTHKGEKETIDTND
jgi:hypothetical protein